MTEEIIKLTQHAHGAGCGCKIAPQVLDEILKTNNPTDAFKALLVGNDAKDDAAVYQLNDKEAIIATTDFFTPIVDDPYTFGQVAAANAISDVYAMGGEPILALAILGWPVDKLPLWAAQKVLEGARSVCKEVNIPLAGGHSIDTTEPIFGLSVNGKVLVKHLKRNNKAQKGDVLFLTKPIGVGVFATAEKRSKIEEEDKETLRSQLISVNKVGAELGKIEGVHAMTDVTGFGLGGHLVEMCEGANLSAEVTYDKIPKLKGIEKYLSQNIIPDATYRNWNGFGKKIKLEPGINTVQAFQLLPDPQTNGGLLIAVAPQHIEKVKEVLNSNGYGDFIEPIGEMIEKGESCIFVQ